MMDGSFISYSEITGNQPTEAEIAELLRPLDARKVLFLLCRINMHLRLVTASEGTTFKRAVGKAQEFLFQNFTDEALFEQAKQVLGATKTHERVLFHPLQLLNTMRCALLYCQGADEIDGVTDEQRYTVGRCCLMMNDLLVPEEEQQKLTQGCDNYRKAALMTQLLPGFEVSNAGHLAHLVQRSTSMFNLLLSDAAVKTEIHTRSGGYDFVQRFRDLTGVALEHWIALTFCCIAFYNQYGGGDGSQQEYKYLWIDPRVVLGTSKISQSDFDTILKMISKTIAEFAAGYALPSKAGPGVDVTAFKFHPLVQIGYLYICSDYAFLVEKMFAGAYWALHDRELDANKQQLSITWGYIFERYVNWWVQGRSFKKAMTFYPFPLWADKPAQKTKKRKKTPEEAFDAVILDGSRMVAMEYKGGFLTLDAKYSLNMRALLRDLYKKIAKAYRLGLGNIRVPGASFVRRAGVVDRPLLLNKRRGIDVLAGCVAALHVGDRHLTGEAYLQAALGLHLRHLLAFGRIEEIELLNLCIGSVGVVELARHQRTVRGQVCCPARTVLPDSGETVRRDRVGCLDHGELGHAGAAKLLSREIGAGIAAHGYGCRLPTGQGRARIVGVERNLDAGGFPEHTCDVHVLKSVKFGLPQLLRGKMRDVVLEHVVLRLQRRELGDEAGIAGRVEDNVPDAEEREGGCSCKKYRCSRTKKPLAVLGEIQFHSASCVEMG